MKSLTCVSLNVALCLITMHAAEVRAVEEPVPADHGILELDVPDGATIVLDRRNQGTKQRFTWDNLASGKSFVSQITVKFVGGGEAQRVAVITGGKLVKVAAHAPSRIVYAYSTDDRRGIYSIEPDGRGGRWLSTGRDTDPAISPDGTQVLFHRHNREEPSAKELWIVSIDGSELRRLIRSEQIQLLMADWSPDGTRIVFSKWQEKWVTNVYVIHIDGSGERQVTGGGHNPRWSPDGEQIVFSKWTSNSEQKTICVINADGSGERRLAGDGLRPYWSPNGKQIVFSKKIDEHGYDDLYMVNADGSGERRLGAGWSPEWSPDGRLLAFIDEDYWLAIMDASGRVTKRVRKFAGPKLKGFEEDEHDFDCANPCWSPDGKSIVYEFVTTPGEGWYDYWQSKLYVVHADGTGNRLFVALDANTMEGTGASNPNWR